MIQQAHQLMIMITMIERARVEEIEDEEAGTQSRWIKDYPATSQEHQDNQAPELFLRMVREEQKTERRLTVGLHLRMKRNGNWRNG